MKYEITFQEKPGNHELQILADGIDSYTESHVGPDVRRELVFFLRDTDGSIVGGVQGNHGNYGWLWVDTLWVSDKIRGRGHGTQLMNHIEGEAVKNGCTNAYLNTFSFQAVEFYKKRGYKVFGELEDFPVGHSVCCLRKRLVQSEISHQDDV